jgi:oligopeptidase A
VSLDLPLLSPEQVAAVTSEAIDRANAIIDAAVAAATDEAAPAPTFEGLFGALDDAAREVATAYGHGAAHAQMTSDEATRNAQWAAFERIEKWRAATAGRADLGEAIGRFERTADLASLADDQRRYVRRWQNDARLAGSTLDPAARAEVAGLTDRLVENGTRFANNLAVAPHLEVARAELEGLPEAFINGLAAGSAPGSVDLPVDSSTYVLVMERTRSRDIRRRFFLAWNNQGYPENYEILETVLADRRRIAELLGYASWQDLRGESLAAGSGAAINRIIDDIATRLEPLVRREVEELTAVLQAEAGAPADLELQDWDWRHGTALLRAKLGLEPDELAAYFDIETVLEGLAALTEEVFGIHLEPHPERTGWHETCRPFDMIDVASGRVLAHLYIDPYARSGKQAGAWVDVLVPGAGRHDERLPPTLGLVLNAPTPGDGPALLTAWDVEAAFHEYGHAMNFACGAGRFVLHREAWIAFDFIEGPSEFVGLWSMQPEVISRFARHHATGAPIPQELVDGLRRAASVSAGSGLSRTLASGWTDARIHGPTPVALDEADRASARIKGWAFGEGGHNLASYTHIVTGSYSAAAYGYAWAEVIRDDLLERFREGGLLSPEMGARYRREILEASWLDDPVAAATSFIGRPWSADAFVRRATGP